MLSLTQGAPAPKGQVTKAAQDAAFRRHEELLVKQTKAERKYHDDCAKLGIEETYIRKTIKLSRKNEYTNKRRKQIYHFNRAVQKAAEDKKGLNAPRKFFTQNEQKHFQRLLKNSRYHTKGRHDWVKMKEDHPFLSKWTARHLKDKALYLNRKNN